MLNSNTFYKIISVLVAVVLWAYVIEATEPVKKQTIQDVPVQLLNEESLAARGLALSGEANYTVDVEIRRKGRTFQRSPPETSLRWRTFSLSIGKNYIP
jgi:YbbR domain-containing protein